jgi:hypothetical protein
MSYDIYTDMQVRAETAERMNADLLLVVKDLVKQKLSFRVDVTEELLSRAGEEERKHLAETIAASAARAIDNIMGSRIELYKEIAELRHGRTPIWNPNR